MNPQNPAYGLLKCLQEYGELASNPVLSLLAGETPVNEQKYPAQTVCFGKEKWRAFYHCHDAPGRSEVEHGHFHVYVSIPDPQTGESSWAHLAALAMDMKGQPLCWFAVNRWVTDGPWLERSKVAGLLEDLSLQEETDLFTRWLSSILCLYQAELLHLLRDRDVALEKSCRDQGREDCFNNHNLYKLAASDIGILDKLMAALHPEKGDFVAS